MYPSASNVHYAQSQPHTCLQSDPVIQTLSQPMASRQPYSQRAELHADQTCDGMLQITTTHVHSAEQPTSLPSYDQWQTASKKVTETRMIVNPQALKRPNVGSGKQHPLTIDSAHLRTKTWKTRPTKALTRSPHQFSSQVSQT
jgi:hypothetical protein